MRIHTTLTLACVLSVGTAAHADVITDWNAAALNAIRSDRTPPPRASRALAILHVAMFDAVNGIDGRYEAYLVTGKLPRSVSREAAASTAARAVLVELLPAGASGFDQLHATILAGIRKGPSKTKGVAWGEWVARQILAARAADGSDAAIALPTGSGAGAWVPTPPAFDAYALPQWGFVAPFAMPTSSFFRPTGPPALSSAQWAQEYNEVKAYGAAVGSLRTPDQDQIAVFWADGAGTETPPGHWNTIAATVSAQLRNTLEDNARLFALLNIAMADAAICAWDAKYFYDFWRPVTAIRNGDTDGNDATIADPSWSSFIATPPFPDYVSGHSAFSGAAAAILARFYRTDGIAFDTSSDVLPGVTRHFESFSAAANEAALSRLYGGIHFRSANEDGRRGGIAIGTWTFTRYLRPRTRHEFN